MIIQSANIRAALRSSQRGFLLNPYRFGGGGGGGDPSFAQVQLLLHGEGTNGGTVITDSSSANRTAARQIVGSTVTSTAEFKYGSSSIRLPGSSAFYYNAPDLVGLNPGASPFTIESWVRFDSVSGSQHIFSNYTDSSLGMLVCLAGGVLQSNLSGDGRDIIGTTALSANTWYHWALSGTPSSSMKLFLNGTQEGSTVTGSIDTYSNTKFVIGALPFSGSYFDYMTGYVDDFRYTIGTARYTSNFTPPAAQFPDS